MRRERSLSGKEDKKNMNKYVVFIPVRGGSKSIPLKNIKPINGRPLVYWTIDAAAGCPLVDKVYVSTDSDAIKDAVERYRSICDEETASKIECAPRDPETATDTASTESAMLDFAGKYEFENIILVQATSPLLDDKNISQGIRKYEEGGYDSLLSVVRQKRFLWEEKGGESHALNYDPQKRPRRQEFDGYFVENGAYYITSRKALLESRCRLSGKVGTCEMDEETYFEIDEVSDWIIVEKLLRRKSRVSKTKEIKLFVTDCDGVLTDGGMYYSEKGDELKKFNTRDGMGIALLREAGIKTAIITGEDTRIVVNRAKKLKIDYLYKGVKDKLPVLKSIAEQEGISMDEVAYMGDDLNDIECLEAAGMGITVRDAAEAAKNAADIVVRSAGGQGAVREAVEYILG